MQQKNYDSSEIVSQLLEHSVNDPKKKGKVPTTAKQDGVTSIRNPYIKNKSVGGIEEYEFSFCSFDNTNKYYHLEIPEDQVEILFDFCFRFRAIKPKAKGLNIFGAKTSIKEKKEIQEIEEEDVPF